MVHLSTVETVERLQSNNHGDSPGPNAEGRSGVSPLTVSSITEGLIQKQDPEDALISRAWNIASLFYKAAYISSRNQ